MSLEIAVVVEDVFLALVAEKISKNPFMKAKEEFQHEHCQAEWGPWWFL